MSQPEDRRVQPDPGSPEWFATANHQNGDAQRLVGKAMHAGAAVVFDDQALADDIYPCLLSQSARRGRGVLEPSDRIGYAFSPVMIAIAKHAELSVGDPIFQAVAARHYLYTMEGYAGSVGFAGSAITTTRIDTVTKKIISTSTNDPDKEKRELQGRLVGMRDRLATFEGNIPVADREKPELLSYVFRVPDSGTRNRLLAPIKDGNWEPLKTAVTAMKAKVQDRQRRG